ncbi:MAG TPA: hypothetical protein VMV92_00600 [Streptosporangiaceae bacterium]|nr:hypothetical protein [Streptosporangiaceae bacterium]
MTRWLRRLAALPLIVLWAVLCTGRFVVNVPLALISGAIEWMLHGGWYWPGWRAMWRWQ